MSRQVRFSELDVGDYFRYGNGWENHHRKTGPRSAETYRGSIVAFMPEWKVTPANRDGTPKEV